MVLKYWASRTDFDLYNSVNRQYKWKAPLK